MTERRNLLNSLRREGWTRLPCDIELTPPKLREFRRQGTLRTVSGYFGLSHRRTTCFYRNSYRGSGRQFFSGQDMPGKYDVDAWGIGQSYGSDAAYHMCHFHSPLVGDSVTVNRLRDFPLPEPIPGMEGLLRRYVRHIHRRGLASMAFQEQTIWERSWLLRGMDHLMMDMMSDDPRAAVLLDRITDHACRISAMFARTGHDIIALGDDIGMQDTLMMSVEMWRKWLKPRLARVIETIRSIKPDTLVSYHSCGYIEPFIPELIEIGVDVLNPVQPECMDFRKIHEQFGDRLSFWGGIGTQSTFPFGSTADVRKRVGELVEICGDRGGLVAAPSHIIEPEVPWANLEAFREEVKAFNRSEPTNPDK